MDAERGKFSSEKEPSEKKEIFELGTAQKIEVLKKMHKLMEMEGKETVSLKEAKEILDQGDVLGPEDVEKYMFDGKKLENTLQKKALEKIKEIPYSKGELEKAKKLGEVLVLRSPIIGFGVEFLNTNIEALRKKFSSYFLHPEGWFEGEKFFSEDFIKEWGWKLVRKEPTIKGATYKEQEKFITDAKNIKRRRPVEIVYDTLLYMQKNGTPPFIDKSDWSSEKLSSKKIVRIGVEPVLTRSSLIKKLTGRKVEYKIEIGSNHPDHPRPNLGVCPQR